MITMIGTGHVFRIAEPVSFIIKNLWPQAVLVELDQRRFDALTGVTGPPLPPTEENMKHLPKSYRRSAKYQNRVSEENETQTGGELLAAINTGKIVGASIICIDRDAEQVMREMESEMPFFERIRFSMSSISDNMPIKRRAKKTQKTTAEEAAANLESMRRKYPTFIRKLIDERDEHMAARIREEASKYESMVIVVGDAHVEGICAKLEGLSINKIRLADLLDPERRAKVKSDVWNDELGKKDDS